MAVTSSTDFMTYYFGFNRFKESNHLKLSAQQFNASWPEYSTNWKVSHPFQVNFKYIFYPQPESLADCPLTSAADLEIKIHTVKDIKGN